MDGVTFTKEQLECLKWIVGECSAADALDFIDAIETSNRKMVNAWLENYGFGNR